MHILLEYILQKTKFPYFKITCFESTDKINHHFAPIIYSYVLNKISIALQQVQEEEKDN